MGNIGEFNAEVMLTGMGRVQGSHRGHEGWEHFHLSLKGQREGEILESQGEHQVKMETGS